MFRGIELTTSTFFIFFSCDLSDLEDALKLLNEDLTFAADDSDSDDSEIQPLLVEICNLKF